MGGQKLAPFECGDDDSGKMQEQFQTWAQGILEAQSKQTSNDAFVEPVEPIITQEVSSCTSSHLSPLTCIARLTFAVSSQWNHNMLQQPHNIFVCWPWNSIPSTAQKRICEL